MGGLVHPPQLIFAWTDHLPWATSHKNLPAATPGDWVHEQVTQVQQREPAAAQEATKGASTGSTPVNMSRAVRHAGWELPC